MAWPVLVLLLLAGCPLSFEYIGGADASNPFRKKAPDGGGTKTPDAAGDGGTGDAVDAGAPADAARTSIADTFVRSPRAERVMGLPCAAATSLSIAPSSPSIAMTCRGRSGLFRSSLPASNEQATWTMLAQVPGEPTSHAALSDDHYAVTHANPDGLTIIDGARGTVKDEVAFAELPDRLAGAIGFTPSTPTNSFVQGDHLYVTVHNVNQSSADPLQRTFHQGGKIRFYLRNDLTITNSTAWFDFTSGKRPTSIAELGSLRMILNSNALAHRREAEATLDRIDAARAPGDRLEPIRLGNIVAQGLAVTEGGLVLIGEHSPDAKLLVISNVSADHPVIEQLPLEGVQQAIVDLVAYRQVSGIIAGSRILYVNHETRQQIPQLTEISGVVGATARDGQYLYLAVAEGDEQGGLWRVDLGMVGE